MSREIAGPGRDSVAFSMADPTLKPSRPVA
jgi:hypothetical protein